MTDLPYTHLLYVIKYSIFKNDYELFVYGVNTNDIYHTIGEYLTQTIEHIKRIDYNICTQERIDYWKNNGYDILTFKDKHKADTERHAHWIFQSETSSAFDKKYKCSKCNRVIVVFDEKDLIHYPYCNCGCKMDEVTGNE